MADDLRLKFPSKEMRALKDRVEGLGQFFSKDDAKALGEAVIDQMQEMIAKGVSPVQGEGRFQGYSESYPSKSQQQRYGKRKRPVNLKLTGDMLRGLSYRVIPSKFRSAVEIYFKDSTSSGQDKSPDEKATANQLGGNGRPPRRIFPTNGRKFAKSIQETVLDHYRAALKKYLK